MDSGGQHATLSSSKDLDYDRTDYIELRLPNNVSHRYLGYHNDESLVFTSKEILPHVHAIGTQTRYIFPSLTIDTSEDANSNRGWRIHGTHRSSLDRDARNVSFILRTQLNGS